MRWDADHSKEWGLFLRRFWRQPQVTCDKFVALLLDVLIEYDLVHGLSELEVNFRQEGGSV